LQLPVVKKQVEAEIGAAHLQQVLLAHETEVAAQFEEEFLQVRHQAALEVALVVNLWQIEKVEQVGVLEEVFGSGIQLCHHW